MVNVLALSTYHSFSVQSLDLEVRFILLTEFLRDHANAHIQTTRDDDTDLVCLHCNLTIKNQGRIPTRNLLMDTTGKRRRVR